jgi:general secretion pathway protein H
MKARASAGFTVIEVLVVLAVLALVLGLVMTHGPVRSQRLELDAAARRVVGALRLARSRAIAEERAVVFALDSGGYRLDRDVPTTWSADVSSEGNRRVVFTPDGGSSGARIVLRDGERAVAVGVDWLTGRAVVR